MIILEKGPYNTLVATVTYGALVGVLLWIADMVGRQLDRLLVQSGQEDLCEIDFRHDRPLETTVQSIAFCEISQVCGSGECMYMLVDCVSLLVATVDAWVMACCLPRWK